MFRSLILAVAVISLYFSFAEPIGLAQDSAVKDAPATDECVLSGLEGSILAELLRAVEIPNEELSHQPKCVREDSSGCWVDLKSMANPEECKITLQVPNNVDQILCLVQEIEISPEM
ncbi:MAG: hypothetical protein OXK80_06735 [Bdellovibrionales bacterium]|nr:hypothetical protein [Bdellovibrionales bacterium]